MLLDFVVLSCVIKRQKEWREMMCSYEKYSYKRKRYSEIERYGQGSREFWSVKFSCCIFDF
jgi:hypothetical protein